jgi:hypothetical protein
MGDDKNIEINGKVIGENTKITLSVKTGLWIIGIMITIFTTILTYTYFDVKSELQDNKNKIQENNQIFINNLKKDLDQKFEKLRDRDDDFIKDIESIKGDVRLILDRTQRLGSDPIEGSPKINNNTPQNGGIKPRNHN